MHAALKCTIILWSPWGRRTVERARAEQTHTSPHLSSGEEQAIRGVGWPQKTNRDKQPCSEPFIRKHATCFPPVTSLNCHSSPMVVIPILKQGN